jgi:predicted RNA-binding protein associated with RNAse of E/G family
MADDYPYMVSNNKIKPIIEAIHAAAKPPKFSHEFLKQIGFNSSNDRAVIPLFRRLGFLNENGSPTNYYDDLKDITKRAHALGDRIRDLYSDLYAINTKIHDADENTIKGAMSRVTGKDAASVARYYATFKAICSLAKFESPTSNKDYNKTTTQIEEPSTTNNNTIGLQQINSPNKPDFHYNIQIHLPATTDLSVYNAIFKSLKDNLMI